jgi:thiol-disulfide isomerase/thioredoxin
MTDPRLSPAGNAPLPAVKSQRRVFVLGGAAVVTLSAFAGGALLFRRREAALQDGSAVLGLVLPDVDGKPQAFSQWRGKVLVVNFWATWCVPCREEMPQFIAAQARDGANGVQFVGIAVDQVDKVRDFAKHIGLNYPAVIGGFGAIELSRQLGNDLAALPFTIVIDRRGRVAHTQLGPVKRAQLDKLLTDLMATT